MSDVDPGRDGVEPDRLAELYRRFAPLVHARARRIVGDDAEDVVQETFLRLMRSRPEEGRMVAWMYTTSTNICLDRLRYLKRRRDGWRQEVRGHMQALGKVTIEALIENRELCRKLIAAADRKTQRVAVLVYIDEMDRKSVADVLGVSRKTVTQRLKRFHTLARKRLMQWKTGITFPSS